MVNIIQLANAPQRIDKIGASPALQHPRPLKVRVDPAKDRSLRGANWQLDESYLRSTTAVFLSPTTSNNIVGFRVASVPEPSADLLTIGAGLVVSLRRRRAASV